MAKPPSASASASKNRATAEAADALAKQLADKPYGSQGLAVPVAAKAKSISISLPPVMVAKLEDAAHANKRSEAGPKTVSAIIREALEAAGY